MKKLFVDTSAFIALAKTNDQNHEKAKAFFEELPSPIQAMTSDYVLDETLTRLRDSLGAEKAVLFVEKIFESRLYQVQFIDLKIFKTSLEKMRKYTDKNLSFTDCTSFVLMQTRNLHTAFTFDDDFRKVGFEMVP